ncbi:structural maintenance of chromosomes protein 6-like isoform X2 [Lineus longissimus]|uniref:structural maintenance of chromosomes protein 6-like isoform X2 n=1 Tax=Lineus longissimus TaxID=88925 RepID=UPI00315C5AC3
MSKRRSSGSSRPTAGPSSKRSRGEESDEECMEIDESQCPDFFNPITMGKEAEVGIIEQVSMKNFMCHNRLDFKFCPHVNFVVGRNGSGKSAILAALVVGLGGKASMTNRGTTIKNFIKIGRSSAETMVRLRNRGTDAFKPHEYGDSIIVERVLRTDGSSSYKLKSKDGRLVSQKREELVHILDQFNVQVENPVAILNQDTSKNFLHSSKPQDKYKFFLKATQLEQMKLDYAYANDQRENTMEIISRKEKMIPQLEKEVQEWQQKFKAVLGLDELRKKVEELKKEMAWALVANKEKELEPFMKQLRNQEARTPKFEKKVLESQEKVNECLKRREEIQKKLQELSKEVKELEPQHEQTKRAVNEKKKIYKNAVMEWRKVESDCRNANNDRKQLLDKIYEIKHSERQDQTDKIRREEQIGRLKDELKALMEERHTLEHQLEQHRNANGKMKEEQYRIRNDDKELKMLISNKVREKKEVEASRNNSLKKFGQFIPDLVKKIEVAHKQGRFHQKPRGPIGAHIHLRDQNWAVAVEGSLKNLLLSFCCNDHQDERVLEQVMKETGIPMGRKPAIICSRFLPHFHDVSRSRATCEFPTILDVLEVEDSVIANCLVDQRNIENIILIRDPKVARNIMMRNVPPNVREAFTPKGDQLLHSPTFRYYSAKDEGSKYLSVNVEENIKTLTQEIKEYQNQLHIVSNRLAEVDGHIRDCKQQENATQTRLMKIREKSSKIQMEIDELVNIEEPEAVDIITLEEEVQKYDEQLETLNEHVQAGKDKCEEAKNAMETAEQTYKEIDQRIRAVADMADPLKDDLGQIDGQIEYARSNKQHYDIKMKEHVKKIKEIQKDLDDAKQDLEEKVKWAEEICDRINTRRSPHNLESEILQIEKRIKTEEKNRGNKEEITKKYYENLNKFKKIRQEVKNCNKFIQILKTAIALRNKQYCQMQQDLSLRVRILFINLLNVNKYSGKLDFNHFRKEVVLNVQPLSAEDGGGARDGAGAKDMKSLSGGERSFATVCFILALWDAMESPFRCLDEFDVFMDMVNRRISLDMMLKAAEQQKGRQFIFLTPQHLSRIKSKSNIRIYKMPDPERGQQTLDFTGGGDA